MCLKCHQVHKKIFWLSQIKEMQWQAHEIIKQMKSPHFAIQDAINVYNYYGKMTKTELEEQIFEIIKEYTTPRETDEKQLNLF